MATNNIVLDHEGLIFFKEELDINFTKTKIFTLSLPLNWNEKTLTVLNQNLLADNKYIYFAFPFEASRNEYMSCDVHPLDVSINGEIIFTATDIPENILSVTMVRLGGVSNG